VEQGLLPGIEGQREPAPGHGSRRLGWLEPIAIVLLALGLNLAGNARTGLWDRDEPRYAVCVREMRTRGDWINPTFNGLPRYHKPVLIYWLMGLSTALAGDNPFGARLVSGLAGAGTAWGVWWLGRRMFGPCGARLAALIFATAPIMVAESKLATTDATLALWLFGCQACLWVLSRGPSRRAAALFWLLLGLATLTKGPIGPAMIAAAALLARWWGWPVPTAKRLHWRWGLAGFLVLTLPWFVLVAVASRGEFLRFAVGNQILHRVVSDVEAHGGFPGYYPVVSALVFYPWSALVPAAVVGAWLGRKSDRDAGFLLGWALGPLILLECFQTKLIHYYLPAFPAYALLLTRLILSVSAEGVTIRSRPLGRLGLALLAGIGLVLPAGLLVGLTIVAASWRWPVIAIALIVAAGTIAGTRALRRGATERAVYSLAATWALVLLALCGWLVPLSERYRTSSVVGRRLAFHSARLGLEPVLLEYQEPGVIYALGRPAALAHDRASFFAQIEDGRSVLTVALPSEISVMRSYFKLVVTPIDQVEGFILNRGKRQVLQIAIVRQGESGSGRSLPYSADGTPFLKQALVE
jgi:4-amino-4-deoxy-L-arabinose transferase-like glycosyltransferase